MAANKSGVRPSFSLELDIGIFIEQQLHYCLMAVFGSM